MTNEQLVAEYAATRSPATLDQIVRDNQRLLHHVLKRFATADEPYEDLLQVANLGLIKAAQRFDPAKGRDASRPTPCRVIEGEVRHHLRDSLLLRQPRWVKKVYAQIEDAAGDAHAQARPAAAARARSRPSSTSARPASSRS